MSSANPVVIEASVITGKGYQPRQHTTKTVILEIFKGSADAHSIAIGSETFEDLHLIEVLNCAYVIGFDFNAAEQQFNSIAPGGKIAWFIDSVEAANVKRYLIATKNGGRSTKKGSGKGFG